jgi:hypothetical protein
VSDPRPATPASAAASEEAASAQTERSDR